MTSSAARMALRDALMRSATISMACLRLRSDEARAAQSLVFAVLLHGPRHRPDVLDLAIVGDAVGAGDHVTATLAHLLDAILYLGLRLLRRAAGERVVEIDVADDADTVTVLRFQLVDVHRGGLHRMHAVHA